MTNRLWWATLNSSSPRYGTWLGILEADEVPLKHCGMHKATLGVPEMERSVATANVEENVEVYEIDLHGLSETQFNRLVAFVSAKFATPTKEVANSISREGFPIRADDVVLAYSMRAFL